MQTRTIVFWIGGVALLGLGGYFAYLNFKPQKPDETPAPPVPVPDKKPAAVPAKSTAPVSNSTQPVRDSTGFGAPPPGGVVIPKMGSKAFAGASGANAYKSATASQTNIYKYYAKGKYIGTWLATEGAFTKLIVEETGLFDNSNTTVWVPTKDLTFN